VGQLVERRALLGVETAIFWHWPSNARRSVVKLTHYRNLRLHNRAAESARRRFSFSLRFFGSALKSVVIH
jgi:hypothetical protein